MGEAARRKKLDPNYGKVISLSTRSLREKHSGDIFYELIKQFPQAFKVVFKTSDVPDNYQTVTEEIRLWLYNKLSIYQAADQAELAKLLFATMVGVGDELSLNPLAVSCMFKAVKDYFTPDELQSLLDIVDEELRMESQSKPTHPCVKFAHEEMTKDAKLSLTSKS